MWKYALTEPRTQTSPRVVSKAVETARMSRSGIMASRSDRLVARTLPSCASDMAPPGSEYPSI